MRFENADDQAIYVRGIATELLLGLVVAESVYKRFGVELTVTSCVDRTHSRESEHYGGRAADLRTWEIKPIIEAQQLTLEHLVTILRAALPADFDVVLEADHVHLEYDPKGKMP